MAGRRAGARHLVRHRRLHDRGALRSRAPHALRLPWVDLALTDANGRLVARRALSPRDFGAPDTIAAAAELPLQLTLDAGATRIAGYTVELFYP